MCVRCVYTCVFSMGNVGETRNVVQYGIIYMSYCTTMLHATFVMLPFTSKPCVN